MNESIADLVATRCVRVVPEPPLASLNSPPNGPDRAMSQTFRFRCMDKYRLYINTKRELFNAHTISISISLSLFSIFFSHTRTHTHTFCLTHILTHNTHIHTHTHTSFTLKVQMATSKSLADVHRTYNNGSTIQRMQDCYFFQTTEHCEPHCVCREVNSCRFPLWIFYTFLQLFSNVQVF